MKKLISLLLLTFALAVVSGCAIKDDGTYPQGDYYQDRFYEDLYGP